MKKVFNISEPKYYLRNCVKATSYNIHTVNYGIETVSYIAPRLWNSVPNECKNSQILCEFKSKI